MEVLARISYARVHWEPINWYLYELDHDRLSGDQNWMRPDAEILAGDDDYASEFRRTLSGSAPRRPAMARISELSQFKNMMRLLTAGRTIIKFVYAQRALRWLKNNSSAKGCIILRHPSAVVASQLHHPYHKAGHANQHPEWTVEVISRVHPIYSDEDLSKFPQINDILSWDLSPARKLAVTACLDLLSSISDAELRQSYTFAVYESLVDNPNNFLKIAQALGLPVVHQPTIETLRQRSRTTSSSDKGSGAKRLEDTERAEIQRIIDAFGIDFYQADGSVNIQRLSERGFSHLVA